MAQEIAVFSVGEILKKLISIVAEELTLVTDFKKELKKFQVSLTMIHSVLRDAEEKQEGNGTIRLWLRRLKDAAYDAEDVLDEIAYETIRRKVETRTLLTNQVLDFFSESNPIAFRLKWAYKIKKINQLLDEIRRDGAGFGFSAILGSFENIKKGTEIPETDSFLDGLEVVGREDEVSKIISLLANNDTVSIVHIVGMAGLGKTTLAKTVCKEVKEKRIFDLTIWVCLSDSFNERRILKGILESLDEDVGWLDNIDSILKRLHEKLKDKKFLLVLDDVWSQDSMTWERLMDRLLKICRTKGNGVIVTTRSEQVASIVENLSLQETLSVFKHAPMKLSDYECWLVIQNRVVRKANMQLSLDLESIGQEIARKCGGLPLLAKVLGGSMSFKVEKNEWLSITNSGAWDSMIISNEILPILKLSFDRLPSASLKQCFAYCGIFPKDLEFEKEKLTQLWMAEGLFYRSNLAIEDDNTTQYSMEDAANQHFSFLLENSFFQDGETDKFGDIVGCKMHDAMHDLAQYVSRFETLGIDGCRKPRVILSKVDVFDDNSLSFKPLRVLDLSDSDIEGLPSWIGKLKHLRYLDISGTFISSLPRSITKLYHLQTLRFLKCIRLSQLPQGIENLVSMMHIHFDDTRLVPIRVGQLVNLRTLPMFEVGSEEGRRIEELGSLNQLGGKLEISKLELVGDKDEAKRANLGEKPNLRHLVYEWSGDKADTNNNKNVEVLEGLQPHQNLQRLEIRRFEGEKFPSWFSDPSALCRLVKLTLDCDNVIEFPALGQLPSLEFLEVSSNSVKRIANEFYYDTLRGLAMDCKRDEIILFPSLRELELFFMSSLEELLVPASMKVFPCLERLRIDDCPELRSISVSPLSIEDNSKLTGLGNEVVTCVRLERMDILSCPKLRYLPNIYGLKSLERLNIMNCGAMCLPGGIQHCKFLRDLSVYDCPNLVNIPDHLGELQSLEFLLVSDCCTLANFPVGSLCNLTRLQKLEIGAFSEDIEEFPDLHFDQNLNSSLKELTLIGRGRTASLPHQIQYLVSLKELKIIDFRRLEALPEWLGNLTSLQSLSVIRCYRLKYFPSMEAMQGLTSLRKLEIVNCLRLEERCTANGPESFKIIHVPSVVIDSDVSNRITSRLMQR